MMTLNYGVCPEHAAPHKGYRDVVQQAKPNYASQLRGSNTDSQILRNQLIFSKTCAAGSRETKLGDSPSLKVPTKFFATCTLGIQWGGKHSFAAIQQVTGKEKGRTANPTLWDACFFNHQENHNLAAKQDNKVTLGNPATYEKSVGQPSGDSLGFLRCRRLISPCMAVTMNCPVVSPSSLTDSIASTTSCGARACTFCDLLFTWSRCTAELLCYRWNPVYRKKEIKKELKWNPVGVYTGFQLSVAALNDSEAPVDCSPTRASNQTVTKDNDMACSHDTQTRPLVEHLYWVISGPYSCAPPKKVCLTSCQVNAAQEMFAGRRLVWAGQAPATRCRSCSMTLVLCHSDVPAPMTIVGVKWGERHA